MADLFKLQDQIVVRLANTVELKHLLRRKRRRAPARPNPVPNDLVMRGLAP